MCDLMLSLPRKTRERSDRLSHHSSMSVSESGGGADRDEDERCWFVGILMREGGHSSMRILSSQRSPITECKRTSTRPIF